MSTKTKVAATAKLSLAIIKAGVMGSLVIVAGIAIYKVYTAPTPVKPKIVTNASATQETYKKVTPARHQCINMVKGSRKLGSGSMIGGTTNYTFTNKHPLLGNQKVICGINGSDYKLETVRVAGVLIYQRTH